MTTSLGLHVKNKGKKSFIILAADKRKTRPYIDKDNNPTEHFLDDAEKVTIPKKDTNFAFTYTGTDIKSESYRPEIKGIHDELSNKNCSNSSDWELQLIDDIIKGKSEYFSDLNNSLKNIDRLQTTFIFGINKPDLRLYAIKNDGLSEQGDYITQGSGNSFAGEYLKANFDYDKEHMDFLEAAILASNAIKNASDFDKYTGGYVDIAIITQDGMELYENVVNLDSDTDMIPHLVAERLSLKNEMKDKFSALKALENARGSMQDKYVDIIYASEGTGYARYALELTDEKYHGRLVKKICKGNEAVDVMQALKIVNVKYHKKLVDKIYSLNDPMQARYALEFVDKKHHKKLFKTISKSKYATDARLALNDADEMYHGMLVKTICKVGNDFEIMRVLDIVNPKYHEKLIDSLSTEEYVIEARQTSQLLKDQVYNQAQESVCNSF